MSTRNSLFLEKNLHLTLKIFLITHNSPLKAAGDCGGTQGLKKSRPDKGWDHRFYRYSCGIFFSCSSNDQSSGLRFELFHLAPLDNHLFL